MVVRNWNGPEPRPRPRSASADGFGLSLAGESRDTCRPRRRCRFIEHGSLVTRGHGVGRRPVDGLLRLLSGLVSHHPRSMAAMRAVHPSLTPAARRLREALRGAAQIEAGAFHHREPAFAVLGRDGVTAGVQPAPAAPRCGASSRPGTGAGWAVFRQLVGGGAGGPAPFEAGAQPAISPACSGRRRLAHGPSEPAGAPVALRSARPSGTKTTRRGSGRRRVHAGRLEMLTTSP